MEGEEAGGKDAKDCGAKNKESKNCAEDSKGPAEKGVPEIEAAPAGERKDSTTESLIAGNAFYFDNPEVCRCVHGCVEVFVSLFLGTQKVF